MPDEQLRYVYWVGDSKEKLIEFPDEIQDKVGYILERVEARKLLTRLNACRDFLEYMRL